MLSARKSAIVCVAAVATLLYTSAHADEVVLKNGDRITGTVVELADGTLSIETEYAGVVKIDWSQVETSIPGQFN